MKKVTGIGGIFFKSENPEKLRKWYSDNLGFEASEYGFNFIWADSDSKGKNGYTIWSPFAATTKYFEPSSAPFMINYRVADLSQLAVLLKAAGVEMADELQDSPYGKFLHIMDPEGNKIELWEPVDEPEE